MIIILAKLAIGLSCAVLGALVAASRRLHELSNRRFDALAIGLGVASRLALFVGVFVILGFEAQADIPGYYHPQGESALAGKLVYRDFRSSYAPLFPYVAAGALQLWRSPKSIILIAVVLEALSLPLWLRSARALLGERAARVAMVLYVSNALPLVDIAIEGQNQSYCAFFFALSTAALVARRPFLSGLAAGASLGVVKILAVLHAPAPFAASGAGKARWLVGAASLPVLIYGGFTLAGADVTFPLRAESGLRSSGNLPFLLTLVTGAEPSRIWSATLTAALVAALVSVVIWALWTGAASEPRAVMPFGALVLLTFMIISKKAYTYYLVIAFFPIAATVASRATSFRPMLAFGLFGALTVMEPTLWFRWLRTGAADQLWHPSAGISRARVAVFLLCEVALVASYAILWWQAFRLLRPRPDGATGDVNRSRSTRSPSGSPSAASP